MLGVYWGYTRSILEVCWGYTGDMLGVSWGYPGGILGVSWGYAGGYTAGGILGYAGGMLGVCWGVLTLFKERRAFLSLCDSRMGTSDIKSTPTAIPTSLCREAI